MREYLRQVARPVLMRLFQIQHLIQIDKGKITINFIHGHRKKQKTILTSTAFREMITYKEKYPNVTINETPNSTDYNDNIQDWAAENLPDVFSFLYSQFDTMAGTARM